MKHVVMVFEGDHAPNTFFDLIEVTNHAQTVDPMDSVDVFARTDHGFRLYPNHSNRDTHCALALTNSIVDPHNPTQDPNFYRPVDAELMRKALEKHAFVLLGIAADRHLMTDFGIVSRAQYIVRDDDGYLLDYETNMRLTNSDQSVNLIVFLGMVKAGKLPLYYLVTNPTLVRIGGGFNVYDDQSEVLYRKVTGQDETLRTQIFAPTALSGSRIIGSNIVATSDEVGLSFFESEGNVLKNLGTAADVLTISTNVPYRWQGNNLLLDTTGHSTSFVSIYFDLGPFFSGMHETECPVFQYVIHKIHN